MYFIDITKSRNNFEIRNINFNELRGIIMKAIETDFPKFISVILNILRACDYHYTCD